MTKREIDAIIDQMLTSQKEADLCSRVAANERERDPEVAEAMDAQAMVQEHIVDLMRSMLKEEL